MPKVETLQILPAFAELALPSELAFGELAGSGLGLGEAGGEVGFAVEVCPGLAVADAAHGGVGGSEGGVALAEDADFVEKAVGEHGVEPLMDAVVEFGAGFGIGYVEGEEGEAVAVVGQGVAGVEGGEGLAGEGDEFEGALDALGVGGGKAGGGGGVELGEAGVEVGPAVLAGFVVEGGAERGVGFGEVGDAFDEGAQVEHGAADNEGNATTGGDVAHEAGGVLGEAGGGVGFGGVEDVDEVVGAGGAFGGGGFSGADVHATVDEGGVGADDFDGETFGKGEGKGGFAAGGGTEEDEGGRGHTKGVERAGKRELYYSMGGGRGIFVRIRKKTCTRLHQQGKICALHNFYPSKGETTMMKAKGFCHKLAAVALALGISGAAVAAPQSVAVTAIVEHPALDAVRDGVREQLKEEGFVEGKDIAWQYQSAQGNPGTAAQIARKFIGDKPAVIVAIATPSAQAVVSATKTVPVVYSAVTDPVAAQLVKSLEPSGTNVTGVSDELELSRQIELIKKVVPNAKRVGVVYNPGEANSVVVNTALKKLLPEHGMELVEAAAPRTVDVSSAARSLGGKVDVIYTSLDNNVVSAYESLVRVANELKIPLVASDTDSVKRGAVAALGVNYSDLGRQTGKIVARILRGEAPGKIASERSQNLRLFLSKKAAAAQGATLSEDLLKEATEVIE